MPTNNPQSPALMQEDVVVGYIADATTQQGSESTEGGAATANRHPITHHTSSRAYSFLFSAIVVMVVATASACLALAIVAAASKNVNPQTSRLLFIAASALGALHIVLTFVGIASRIIDRNQHKELQRAQIKSANNIASDNATIESYCMRLIDELVELTKDYTSADAPNHATAQEERVRKAFLELRVLVHGLSTLPTAPQPDQQRNVNPPGLDSQNSSSQQNRAISASIKSKKEPRTVDGHDVTADKLATGQATLLTRIVASLTDSIFMHAWRRIASSGRSSDRTAALDEAELHMPPLDQRHEAGCSSPVHNPQSIVLGSASQQGMVITASMHETEAEPLDTHNVTTGQLTTEQIGPLTQCLKWIDSINRLAQDIDSSTINGEFQHILCLVASLRTNIQQCLAKCAAPPLGQQPEDGPISSDGSYQSIVLDYSSQQSQDATTTMNKSKKETRAADACDVKADKLATGQAEILAQCIVSPGSSYELAQ